MTELTISAGFDRIDYGFVDSDGWFIGADPDAAPTAGNQTGSGLTRLEGAVTVPLSPSEAETVNVPGDDETKTQFSFEAADLPSGVLQVAVMDLGLEAKSQGTQVETLGSYSIGARQPSGSTPAGIAMLFQRQSKNWAAGAQGATARMGMWAPNLELRPRGSDFTQRAHNPEQWNIVTSKTDRKPWGATFTAATNGTTAAALIPFAGPYIVQLHRHTGNNSEDTFNLPYAAVAGANNFFVWLDGELVTGGGVDYTATPGSGTTAIVFGSAPGNGVRIHTLYGVAAANI